MKFRSRTKATSRVLPRFFRGDGVTSLVFALAALVLFLLSAFQSYDLRTVRTTAMDVVSPVLSVVNMPFQKLADHVHTVSGLAALQGENARLREENMRLRKWYQMALTLEAENKALQDLLNITLPPDKDFITARVVADPGNAYIKTLLVKAGRRDGVADGQPVLASYGVIGRIVTAGQTTARVLLLTDVNSRIPVVVEGADVRAILAGDNGPHPVLKHLPQETKLTPGSRVITSGHGSMFPYGLPVGTVIATETGGWAIKPFVRTDNISFVRIIENTSFFE